MFISCFGSLGMIFALLHYGREYQQIKNTGKRAHAVFFMVLCLYLIVMNGPYLIGDKTLGNWHAAMELWLFFVGASHQILSMVAPDDEV
jgi:hypothetical protein